MQSPLVLKAALTEQAVASNGAAHNGKLLDFDELTDIIRSDQGHGKHLLTSQCGKHLQHCQLCCRLGLAVRYHCNAHTCFMLCRMVHDTDIVELELKSKKFSLAVRKKEAIEQPEAAHPVRFCCALSCMRGRLSILHLPGSMRLTVSAAMTCSVRLGDLLTQSLPSWACETPLQGSNAYGLKCAVLQPPQQYLQQPPLQQLPQPGYAPPQQQQPQQQPPQQQPPPSAEKAAPSGGAAGPADGVEVHPRWACCLQADTCTIKSQLPGEHLPWQPACC